MIDAGCCDCLPFCGIVHIDMGSLRFEITCTEPETPDLFLPVKQPSREVLPAPLGPKMAVTWPDLTLPSRLLRMFVLLAGPARKPELADDV